jgi:hypothetical protein
VNFDYNGVVVDAPSFFDARRYALAKYGPDVVVESTDKPAVATLRHVGNDFSISGRRRLVVECTHEILPGVAYDPVARCCSLHEAPETIHYRKGTAVSEPKEMETSELSLAVEQGKTFFVWVSYATDEENDDEECGLWIEMTAPQACTLVDHATEEWDTLPVWERGDSLYVGMGPEPE